MEAAISRLVGEGIPKDSSSVELLAWIGSQGSRTGPSRNGAAKY